VATFARRDTKEKGTVPLDSVEMGVREILATISDDMNAGAWEKLDSAVVDIDSMDGIPEKIVRFGWCGSEECGHAFEERTGLALLGTPYETGEFKGKCICCGKETDVQAYAARSM
jgi:prolyl-tRNA synthetase